MRKGWLRPKNSQMMDALKYFTTHCVEQPFGPGHEWYSDGLCSAVIDESGVVPTGKPPMKKSQLKLHAKALLKDRKDLQAWFDSCGGISSQLPRYYTERLAAGKVGRMRCEVSDPAGPLSLSELYPERNAS